ncbi:MAG TPA: hypothetical protein VE988_14330 [Gemmataceae bacterium]|nr:hypothetical protein [Gemmataceae bacterium]
MKRILWTALLALPFCAQSAQAQINISHSWHHPGVPPISVNLNGPCLDFRLFAGGGRTQLGPWYQYWPYEAHFQSPAPMGIGGGPYMMTLPPQFGQGSGMQYGTPVPVGPPQYAQSQYGPQQYAQTPYSVPQYAQAPYGAPQYAQTPYSVPHYAQTPYSAPTSIPMAAQRQPQAMPQQPMYQPVGYYPGAVPSYWYGR